MKDRDALEEVIGSWLENVAFDMVRQRDERLRTFYDTRYDSRANVLDWDYSMELQPLSSVVHKVHFREWRMSGIAFELRDSAYVAPNRSLASMAAGRLRGNSVLKRGFWGDVANSPYSAVGVECDDSRFFKQSNGQHVKTSCDVAYYNVLCWLTALETGRRFCVKEEDFEIFEFGSSVASGGGLAKGFLSVGSKKQPTIQEEDEVPQPSPIAGEGGGCSAEGTVDEEARVRLAAAKMNRLPRFVLRLASGDWKEVVRKPKHQHHYDLLVVASHQAHVLVDQRLNELLKPQAAVLLETAKFIVETRKANRQEFGRRVLQLGAVRGWQCLSSSEPDGSQVSHIGFRFDEDSAEALATTAREKLKLAASNAEQATDEVGTDSAHAGQAPLLELTCGSEPPKEDEVVALTANAPTGATITAPAQGPAVAQADVGLDDRPNRRICAITGLPAKYRDPVSGLPYANLEAFRELRKLHPDPKASNEASAPAGDNDVEIPLPSPAQPPIILSTGVTRRINKIA